MKNILIATLLLTSLLSAQELRIKANSFSADEGKGLSYFEGDVNIIKLNDELNASKVTIFTDKNNQPTKFIAKGDVSFKIQTKLQAKYEGTAEKVIYIPQDKEYRFYGSVHLKQIDDKKEIQGDEVILNTTSGKAYAKGKKKEPIIMIFDIKEEK